MTNLARFTISGTPSSQAGYDVIVGGAPVLQLEVSSEDVRQVTFEVHSASDPASPRCSRNAPALTLNNGHGVTGYRVDAFNPASPVTISAGIPGATAAHIWEVRCLVNGGTNQNGTPNPDLVFSRFVAMRSAQGLRKLLYSERSEYDPIDTWAGAINELIDLWATSGGSVDPTKLPLSGVTAMQGPLDFGDHEGVHLSDPTQDDSADTRGARNAAISIAVNAITTLINQKMNAFGIGILTAELSNGARHVPATLPDGAIFLPIITGHNDLDHEGAITVTGNTTGINVLSSDGYDSSIVTVLWIKL